MKPVFTSLTDLFPLVFIVNYRQTEDQNSRSDPARPTQL